jgi:hypothetical protein
MVVRGLRTYKILGGRIIHQGDTYSQVEVKLQLNTLKKVKNEENLELWNSSKCSQRNR